MVKPAAPQFGADARPLGLELIDAFKLAFRFVVGAEIDAVDQIRKGTVVDHRSTVYRIQLAIETRRAHLIAYGRHIGHILAVRAVFILDLGHQDRSAPVDLQRRQFLPQSLQPAAARRHIGRIKRPRLDRLVRKQPGRIAAAVPFAADIGSGTQQDPQALFLRHPDPSSHIEITGKVKNAWRGLVGVPEHIGAERIQPQAFQLAQAVAPAVARNARIMHLASHEVQRQAIKQELVAPDRKARLRRQSGRQRDQAAHRHAGDS